MTMSSGTLRCCAAAGYFWPEAGTKLLAVPQLVDDGVPGPLRVVPELIVFQTSMVPSALKRMRVSPV